MSEIALNGTKLQKGLGRVVTVWVASFVLLLITLDLVDHPDLISFLIFWAGAFLSWFGVRSHIESSILLRMVYLLRRGPQAEHLLLAQYDSLYGEEHRL